MNWHHIIDKIEKIDRIKVDNYKSEIRFPLSLIGVIDSYNEIIQ